MWLNDAVVVAYEYALLTRFFVWPGVSKWFFPDDLVQAPEPGSTISPVRILICLFFFTVQKIGKWIEL